MKTILDPFLYFDAMYVKSREDGPVKTKAVYLALGEERRTGNLTRKSGAACRPLD